MKKCSQCGLEKELSEFGVDRRVKDDRRAKCKLCRKADGHGHLSGMLEEEKEKRRESHRRWCKKYPERHKASHANSQRKGRYGVDAATYKKMLIEQNYRCAICNREEVVKTNGKDVDNLPVDHDHSTGKVRKLLCHTCNKGLGRFKDDPTLLEAAAKYLREHEAR